MLRFDDGSGPLREEPALKGGTVDLSRLLIAIRRRRRAIGISVLVWCALGMFYTLTTPRYYDAYARVLLDDNIGRTLQQVSASTDLTTTDTTMASAQLVISSDEVVGRVVDQLALQNNPAFTNPPVPLTARILGTVFMTLRLPLDWLRQGLASAPETTDAGGSLAPDPAQIAQLQRDATLQALQQEIEIGRIGQSSAFTISYRSNDPELATQVVNTFAQVYVSDVLNANFDATERMTSWMQDRLNTLESDASKAAQAAKSFRASNGLVAKDNATMSENAVSALNSDLTEAIASAARARAQVSALEAVVARGVEGLTGNGVPSGLPSIEDPDFQTRQQDLIGLLSNLDRVKAIPNVQESVVRMSQLRVDNAAERLFASVKLELEKARGEVSLYAARVTALRESLDSAIGNDARSGSAQVQLRALEDRAATLSALYQSFLTKFQEIDQQKSFPVSNVRVLNLAQMPLPASGPSTKSALALCIVLGLMTGLMIAAIREWRDRFVYTAEQVNDEVGTHFLGYLPEIPPLSTDRPDQQLPPVAQNARKLETLPPSYALEKPRSQFAETLRGIRLSSRLVGHPEKSQVIAISSARPDEGKTLIAYNLATSIAMAGNSVMLIDADPHRSGLSTLFGLTYAEGLLEVLGGGADWRMVRKTLGETGVDLIPGLVPRDFSHFQEMLASDAFGKLIGELRQSYDVVILDLAPMGPVSDARAVVDDVDHLVMVAEWGKTSKLFLYRLINSDPRISRKVLGLVLNKVDMKRLRAYANEGDSSIYMSDYDTYYVQ